MNEAPTAFELLEAEAKSAMAAGNIKDVQEKLLLAAALSFAQEGVNATPGDIRAAATVLLDKVTRQLYEPSEANEDSAGNSTNRSNQT